MTPTIFGFLIIAAALFFMRAPITTMLGLVLVSSLLGAASALNLPGLGGANVTPASLALLFLVLRILLSPAGRFPIVANAFQQNISLAFFCIYGAVTAFIFPSLFYHTISLPQLRAIGGGLFATAPVEFSSQNITTSVYLLGTFLGFLSAYIACSLERRSDSLLRVVSWVSWLHIGFGILDIALSKVGLHDLLDFFRNASYSQLNQDIGGIQRVAGIFPEASAYAAFGFAFLVLNTELWVRRERQRLTGFTALTMLIMLLLTTSSTAYVSVAIYAVLLLLRMIFTPMHLPFAKKLNLLAIGFAAITILLVLEVFMPAMNALMFDILQQMTLQKLNSESGIQRTFWAHKGWEAFWSTSWIGVGAGSFRSSGLLSSVAGSIGAIGLLTLFGSVWSALKPLRPQSHAVDADEESQRIKAAFGWTAALMLIPALFSLPSPDPGLLFGLFAGIAASKIVVAQQKEKISVPHRSLGNFSRREARTSS